MDTCDVLIVGGGPAGSTCARALRDATLDVLVVDKAVFPRDKVCAGWITPSVLDELQIDANEYQRGRTCQAITGFRIGRIGSEAVVEIAYERPVSYGIRRCEFDDYLLRRSGARLSLGVPVGRICRRGGRWIVNDTIESAALVGAGGQWCPVAQMINGKKTSGPLVSAQEMECALDATEFPIAADRPELYFTADLSGYGWCIRKGRHLSVGFGSLHGHRLAAASAAFVDFLKRSRRLPREFAWRPRGHSYLVAEPRCREIVTDGALLVGDAAGLADSHSGEGIRPAIESGLFAATTIRDARGDYRRARLAPYEQTLFGRPARRMLRALWSHAMPPWLSAMLAPLLLSDDRFVRQILLDRWFLHAG